MRNDERQFEELFSKVTFDDKCDYHHRNKLQKELLAAFARRQWQEERRTRPAQGGEIGVWRTIMRSGFDKLTTSRITKLAAVAAIVAIAVFLNRAIFRPGHTDPITSIEFLAKAQAAEQALFTGDKIVHILNEITIYGSHYNPKTNEMIEKLGDPKITDEEMQKLNRELVSSWMINWLPMCSLEADGGQRLTEIRLSRDANQPYTIFDNSWYEPRTGRFVRTMETDDKVIFVNAYDGEFVSITETAADGKIQLKGEAVTSDFRAPENPAEFLGITAGVRQCLSDKCVAEPIQDVVEDKLEDGTPVLVYKLGFPDPWGELNTYYLFKVRRADEIIAEIEYTYMGQQQMLIRRIASEVAIDNVSVRHMVDRAEFETYIFASDPSWTQQRMIVDVVDPMNPSARMFLILYTAEDGRHVLLIQSTTHNKYMGMMFKQAQARSAEAHGQGLNYTEYANGCKLYANIGGEAFWTDLCFRNCGFEPAQDRVGYIVETPSGTVPLIAVNGAVTEEELAVLVNSLIPAKEYEVK